MKKLTVKFSNAKIAGEYARSLYILENRAEVNLIDNSVIITSDDAIAMAFARNTINDIQEEINYHNTANRLLKTITESLSKNVEIDFKMIDGTMQTITPSSARTIANAYDNLAKENQTAFLIFAAESKKSYSNAVNFAKANEKE